MVNNYLPDNYFSEALAAQLEPPEVGAGSAPARLKSKIYPALVRRQQASGPLLSLPTTKAAGRGLCFFEELVRISPVGQKARSFNCCSVCHARMLAEKVENAPIYWNCCPYVSFQNR
jgi:hypothetical protein